MKKFALGTLIVMLFWASSSPAAAQTSVTVSTAAELEAAVAAAAGSTSPVDIRIRAGAYDLQSGLDLSVAAGATATLRNYGDGRVTLRRTEGRILRTGFATRRGSYVIRGLTLSGADTGIEHAGGDIWIESSTFYDNLQGFYADSSQVNITILNSTFFANGTRCGEGSGNCGGIWLDFYRSATLTNLTVAGAGNGVGIYGLGYHSVGPTALANSMILFNQWNCNEGAPGVLGTNNIVDEPGAFCPGSTLVSVGFQFPGFGDYGGLVQTWPLTWDVTVPLPNPAIGGGDPASCPSHDARGAIRRSPCDIGAHETSPRGFTLESATGAGGVTIETAPGLAAFTNFHAIDPHTLPQTGLPPSVTFPFGVFEWRAMVTPFQSLPIAITFPTAVSSPVQYWKFDPLAGQWFDLCPLITCTLSPDQRTLSFTIADGGVGDMDLAVGSIRDPGGLGVDGNGPRPPNLTLAKSLMSADTVGNGAFVTYRLTATNQGAGPTTGDITITDALHPSVAFLPAASDPRCTANLQVVTCIAAGPLDPGSSDVFVLSVQVSADAARAGESLWIDNSATVQTDGDSDPSDDVSTVRLTVNGPANPNLTIAKSLVSASTVNNGGSATYRVTVSNTGSGPTTGTITVTDTLDPRLGFVAPGSDPRCVVAVQQVTCVAAVAMAPGASDSFELAVQVAADAAPNHESVRIDNTATVSTAGDANAADNHSNIVELTVNGPNPPNVTIAQAIVANGVVQAPVANNGDTLLIRLRATNIGRGPTTAPIVVTDILDPGLSFVVLGSDHRCSAVGQTVTCASTTTGVGQSGLEDFLILVQVAASAAPAGGSVAIANTAVVSTANDSNPADDASTLMLTVFGPRAPNMGIVKQFVLAGSTTTAPLTVNNGEVVVYRLRTQNAGTGPTTGPVTVTDTLDPRLTFIGLSTDSRCTAVGQVVTCLSGPVGAGQFEVFDISVQVAAGVQTNIVQIDNVATVSTQFDADPVDDTSNIAVLVVSAFPPNAHLLKRFLVGGIPQVGSITVYQGTTVTYQLQVYNAGVGATVGSTVVTDTLDPALGFVAGGSDSRCSAAGQLITCVATGVIPSGGRDNFNIVAYVGPNILPTGSPIRIFNSATLSTPGDSDSGDNVSNILPLDVRLGAATSVGTGGVQPTDYVGMLQPITLTFSNVTSAGFTTANPLPLGSPLPPNFLLKGQVYDITTTAQYESTITICFFGSFLPNDRLLHYDGSMWVELPGQQLVPGGGPYTQLCAETTSLSPFAVGGLNTSPTLFLPSSITAEAASAAGASVTFTISASDVEDGPLAASCTRGSGAVFPLGVTTVSCSVTDASGATATGAFTVTVSDTTPPAITTPGNITQTAPASSGASVSFAVTASDLVSGSLTPSCAPVSGSVFPIGTTTVTCSAQDAAGNDATAGFTVTVLAPEIEPQAPTLTRITPDSGKRGTFQVVFFQGTGLRRKLAVRFSGEDISVIEVVSVNTTAAALVFIKPTAVRGSRAVTVSNAFGTSNSVTFVVR